MVIKGSVLLKIPLINSGRYHRFIRNIHDCNGFAAICKGFLDTNAEGTAIRFISHAKYVSAQVNSGALYSMFQKKVFDSVSNIALGNGAKIQHHAFFGKGHLLLCNLYILIIYQRKGSVQFFLCGDFFLFGSEIPQRGYRTYGNVKGAFGKLTVFQTFGNKFCGFGRNGIGVFL